MSPPDPAREPAPPLAGLARRMGAWVYELLLATALLFIGGFALAPLLSPQPVGVPHRLVVPAGPVRGVGFVALFALLGTYFVWSWTGGRRTLPQKTWRLALGLPDGRPVPLGRALARYLAAWIGPALALAGYVALRPAGLGAHALWLVALGWLWALVDRDRQFLHDRIAGTRLFALPR